MKNIDFLPAAYSERLKLRQARVWWVIVATTFGAAIAASSLAQFGVAQALNYQLAAADSAVTIASEQDKRYAELVTEVNRGSDLASLCVYLKHPWPRTQILASLITPLPEAVRLTDVRLRQEAPPTPEAAVKKNPEQRAEPAPAAGAAADLARLRAENDHLITLVEVTGETTDANALHRYVTALAKSDLLVGARLKSFEAAEARGSTTIRFELRAQVRPAYGLAGGPEGPPKPQASAESAKEELPALHDGPAMPDGGGPTI